MMQSFLERFAVFIQRNPKLAAGEDAQITLTLKQLRQVANRFYEAGYTKARSEKSVFETIFGR
jgi:hypothetical protein